MGCVIKFAKKSKGAILPSKRVEDGCYDLYVCIGSDFVIPAHTVKLVPTGLMSVFESGYRVSVRERGSNTKSGLIVMAGQIDSGYRGEWFVALYNANDCDVVLTNHVDEVEHSAYRKDGLGAMASAAILVPVSKAVAQFALEIVPEVDIVECSIEDVESVASERGKQVLGSTGK